MKLNEITYKVDSRGTESIIVGALRKAYGLDWDEMDRLIQQTQIPRHYAKLAGMITKTLKDREDT